MATNNSILLIVACALVLSANARSLSMKATKAEYEQKTFFRRPLPPFLGGHGFGRPAFGLGPGFGGIAGGSGGMGFGAGSGTGSGFGAGSGTGTGFETGSGSGFRPSIGMGNGGGFGFGFGGDNGGTSPNGNGAFAEGGDAALGNQKP